MVGGQPSIADWGRHCTVCRPLAHSAWSVRLGGVQPRWPECGVRERLLVAEWNTCFVALPTRLQFFGGLLV